MVFYKKVPLCFPARITEGNFSFSKEVDWRKTRTEEGVPPERDRAPHCYPFKLSLMEKVPHQECICSLGLDRTAIFDPIAQLIGTCRETRMLISEWGAESH